MKKNNIQIILSCIAILISIVGIVYVFSQKNTKKEEIKIERETNNECIDNSYSKFNDTTIIVSAETNFQYVLFRLITRDAEADDAFAIMAVNTLDPHNINSFIVYHGSARAMYGYILSLEMFAKKAEYDSEIMELNTETVFLRKCKGQLKGVAIIKGIRQNDIKYKVIEDKEIAQIKKDFIKYCTQYNIQYL